MGWLWSSNPTGSPSTPESAPSSNGPPPPPHLSKVALTDEQRIRIFGKPGPSPSKSREQNADAELDAFLKSFEGSETPASATKTSTKSKEVVEEPPANRILPDGSLDISPDVIYPRTMTCHAHFDQAFYCQSLGGKFNDIYRFGELKSCSEQWGAFWFCMRTRTLPPKEKEVQIAEYYRLREERKKKDGGSSEDIWEIRKVAVPKAFWKDPDLDGESDSVKMQE